MPIFNTFLLNVCARDTVHGRSHLVDHGSAARSCGISLTIEAETEFAAISADDTFERIFLNENVRISIKISPKFVPKDPINNDPALV